MPELRWSLLIIGLLVVAGIYLISRSRNARDEREWEGSASGDRRAEPVISGEELWGDELDQAPDAPTVAGDGHPEASAARPAEARPTARTAPPTALEPEPVADAAEPAKLEEEVPSLTAEPDTGADGPPPDPDRIVAMRVAAPAGQTLSAEEMVLKLRELGLRHGKYGIFHRHAEDGHGPPLFSVASMTEPGSFDLTTLRDTRLPGVSLFMVLPGSGDPVECFDTMVQCARDLARDLKGEVLDESGSTWSIQRERYVREDLIRYRLHYGTRPA